MNRFVLTILTAGALLALDVQPAAATSIIYQGGGRGTLIQVAVTGAGYGWANRTVWAGELKWVWGEDPPPNYGNYDPTFHSYCADLLNTLTGTDDVDIKSTNLLQVSSVPDAGGKAAWLFNTFAPAIHTQNYVARAEKVAANQNAAALQVAIWASMLDSSNDRLGGTFQLSTIGVIKTKAIDYLSQLYAGGPSGYNTGAASWFDTEVK